MLDSGEAHTAAVLWLILRSARAVMNAQIEVF